MAKATPFAKANIYRRSVELVAYVYPPVHLNLCF